MAAPLKAELTLEPASDWRLREYDDKCRMIRTFGSGADRLTMWVDQGGPGSSFNITLIGEPVRYPYGPQIAVTFEPGEKVTRNYITSKSSKGRPVLAMFGVQPISFKPETPEEQEDPMDNGGEETVDFTLANASDTLSPAEIEARYAAITAMTLSGGGLKALSLEMGRFMEMVQPLSECADALTKRLSGRREDGSYNKGTPSLPKDQDTWAKQIAQNYPFHLLREGQQGTVGVRLTINKQGRPSFCQVLRYDGPASFNDIACLQLLRYARFEPARSAEGEPRASFYLTSVDFKISY
ncbi:MAG: energy transducer TonB [Pseudomonadota bacterium]